MKFTIIQNSFFFLLITFISILFFWIISGFILIIFWAIVLGIIFFPLYNKILKITKKRKNISSLLTIIIILLLLFLPIYLTTNSVAKEAIGIYQDLTTKNNNVSTYLDKIAYEDKFYKTLSILHINPTEAKTKIINSIKNIAILISNKAINFGKYTVNTIISFFIMIYLLFFIFKDGVVISKRISDILPIGNAQEELLFKKFVLIVRAIFKGTLIISLIQGILGGILLYIVGIKIFLLLTILMIFLAILPAIGPTLVLLPTGIFFLLTDNLWQGSLLIIGTIFISNIDNILRPILVGNATEMHDALVMISILGGLAVFGITGFIIGPVIAGIFVTIWLMFEKKYQEELKKIG